MSQGKSQIELLIKLNDQLSGQFQSALKVIEASGKKIADIEKQIAEQTSGATKELSKQALASKELKGTLKDLGATLATLAMGGLAVGAGLVTKAFSDATRTGIDFETSIANLRAILQPATSEMELLATQARAIGSATKFTAGQAADAMTELGKMGFTTNQILASTADVVNYAGANNISMAESALQVSTALRQFGMEASQAGEVSDVMAKSFTVSALGVDNLGDALRYVGPIARSANASFETTTAALAVLANNGIKGSQAGTSLRRMFAMLSDEGSKVSKVLSSQGVPATASLTEKMQALKDLGMSTSQAIDYFGIYAQAASLILVSGADAFEEYNQQLNRTNEGVAGFTKRMAEIQMDSVAGQWKILISVVEELGLKFYEAFGPNLKEAVKDLILEAQKFGTWMDENTTEVKMWSDNIVSFINVGIDAVGTLLEAWKVAAKIIDTLNPFKLTFADDQSLTTEMRMSKLTEAVKKQIDILAQAERKRDSLDKNTFAWRQQVEVVSNLMTALDEAQKAQAEFYEEAIKSNQTLRPEGWERQNQLLTEMMNNTYSLGEAKRALAEAETDLRKAQAGEVAQRGGTVAIAPEEVIDIAGMQRGTEKAGDLIQQVLDKASLASIKANGDKYSVMEAQNSAYIESVNRRFKDLQASDEDRARFAQALLLLEQSFAKQIQEQKTEDAEKETEKRLKAEQEAELYTRELRIAMIKDDRQRELAETEAWYNLQAEKYKGFAETMEAITASYRAKQDEINTKYNEIEAQKRLQSVKTLNDGLEALFVQAQIKNKALRIALKTAMIGEAAANAYMAGNKALAYYGPTPWGYAAMFGAISTGLANAGRIKAQKFSTGGIVEGSSFIGDNVPAMLNSKEMVLTQQHQSDLWSMLNGAGRGRGGSSIVIENITVSASSSSSVKDSFKDSVRNALWELQEEGVL